MDVDFARICINTLYENMQMQVEREEIPSVNLRVLFSECKYESKNLIYSTCTSKPICVQYFSRAFKDNLAFNVQGTKK
jgi:hypothetical protein